MKFAILNVLMFSIESDSLVKEGGMIAEQSLVE
jgi:hypothetical protein